MKTRSQAQTSATPWRSKILLSLVVITCASISGWWLWNNDNPTKRTKNITAETEPSRHPNQPKPNAPATVPHKAPGALSLIHSEFVQVASAPPDARDTAIHTEQPDRPHSHPIDNARRRIYRENSLNAAMMGAMNVGDHQGLRELIDEYRRAYPEDEFSLQEGYKLVADCLERLTANRQSEAREYWRHNRGSLVRRFIRRHCLEQPIVDG